MQTFLTQRITAVLSEKLGTKVSVKGVNIEFFKTVVLEGIYIEDLKKDTLVFAEKLKADISNYNIDSSYFHFSKIGLETGVFKLKQYSGDSVLNLQFIIDAFATDDTSASSPIFFTCDKLSLSAMNFAYSDYNYAAIDFGMDFNHIAVNNINAEVLGFNLSADTINARISAISFNEKSGFEIKHLKGNFLLNHERIELSELDLNTSESQINGLFVLEYDSFADFSDFLNKVKLNTSLVNTRFQAAELAYFVPELKGLRHLLVVNGNVKGTIANLKGRNLELQFGPNSYLKGSMDITGLPEIDETFFSLSVSELSTNKVDIDLLPMYPFSDTNKILTPDNVASLGKMKFRGDITGFFSDFVAYGNFSSQLGSATTDIEIKTDSVTKKVLYSGRLATNNFDIGTLLSQKDLLGKVSLDANINGSGLSLDEMALNMKGNINDFGFNGYTYRNINVEGDISKKKFNGYLSINDNNINLDFNGAIDFEKKLPLFAFEARVKNANLYNLNIAKRDSVTSLSVYAVSNFHGVTLDDIEGEFMLSNINYKEGKKKFQIDNLTLVATKENNKRVLRIDSDIADGLIEGDFKVASLPESFSYLLSKVAPAYFPEQIKEPKEKHQLEYRFLFHKTEKITEIFIPQLIVKDKLAIAGYYNSATQKFSLDATTPLVYIDKRRIDKFYLKINALENVVSIDAGCKNFFISDSTAIENIDLLAKALNNNMQFGISWENQRNPVYKGNLSGLATVYEPQKIRLSLLPSQFIISDSAWYVNDNNEINIDSSSIFINNLAIYSGSQKLQLSGKLSENPADELQINIENFNASNANLITSASGFEFGGIIGGKAVINNPYKALVFRSDVSFSNLSVNEEIIGSGNLFSKWDSESESVLLNCNFSYNSVKTISAKGIYYPNRTKDNLDIKTEFEQIHLSMFAPYVKEYLPKLEGMAQGSVHITGNTAEPKLNGKIILDSTNFIFSYLNTEYAIYNQTINIVNNNFLFNKIAIKDIKEQKETKEKQKEKDVQPPSYAYASGKITHNNFSDFNLDIQLEAEKGFMCLNTTSKDNSLYYGKAYVDYALVKIYGHVDNMHIDVNAKTGKGTDFNLPLSGPTDISENTFITFVSKNAPPDEKSKQKYQANLSGIQLNFNFEVTPDARIQLIFDEAVGDIMKARGKGNLTLEINTNGRFNMFGEYVVEEGDYLFTLQNIINKKFVVEKGGTITWSGNPYEAILNLDAVYKLRASLSEIIEQDTVEAKKRVQVECHLLMTNKLMNPDIKFDIKLPTVQDDRILSEFKSKLANEQEINKQVFALLMMNTFVTPEGGTGGGSGVSASSTELLSNQLSNWLSQISNDFDIGVKYRPGDVLSKEQMEVALSTQLLNDRLTFEGNLGVTGNGQQQNSQANTSQQQNTLIGDATIVYKITDDGKLRAKAFNKTNDFNIAYATNGPYTQGVGVFYRQEFDTFSDLWKRMFKKNKEPKTEEIPEKIENSSGN